MRDPNRINGVLQHVARVWRANPDLRLMQLLAILAPGDQFYLEDHDLVKKIFEFEKQKAEEFTIEHNQSSIQSTGRGQKHIHSKKS